MRSIHNFGRAKYAFVELKLGAYIHVAYKKLTGRPIDWKKLTKLAKSAKIEAQ